MNCLCSVTIQLITSVYHLYQYFLWEWSVSIVCLCDKEKIPTPFSIPFLLRTARQLKTAATAIPTKHKHTRISDIPTPRATVHPNPVL